MHKQVNLPVHRNCHLCGYDIVLGILIVSLIETEEIGVGLVDLVGMKGAELSIGAGIAEIECELAGLHLDGHRIGCRRSEIDARPSLGPEYAEGQNFGTDQQESRDNEP